MSYKKILDEAKWNLPKERQWWPDFFYHFTDVHNAASIIESGWIYSRERVYEQKIMANDNASRIVIDMTKSENKIYGRLYFRPLTPTQYHNEGFKPVSVRNQDINASCPIPVFFLLSVEKTMALEGIKFAEKGISGGRHNIEEGELKFSKLNFEKIYHDGYYDKMVDCDIKEYKHSEVIIEGGFPVPKVIRGIVCRSNAERETLLYLLKKHSLRLYESYKKMVMYKPSLRMFFNNGVFIKEVSIVNNTLLLELNNAYLRVRQGATQVLFDVKIEVTYLGDNNQRIQLATGAAKMNYCTTETVEMKLEDIRSCTKVLIKVTFDEAVMYENELIVSEAIIW